MNKIIKGLLRLCLCSAVVVGIGQITHAASVPVSTSAADKAVTQNQHQASSSVTIEDHSKTAVGTPNAPTPQPPAAPGTTNDPAASDITLNQHQSTTSSSVNSNKSDSQTTAIAPNDQNPPATQREANGLAATLQSPAADGGMAATATSDPAATSATVAALLAATPVQPTAHHAPAVIVTPTTTPNPVVPATTPTTPTDKQPFNPLSSSGMILNLGSAAMIGSPVQSPLHTPFAHTPVPVVPTAVALALVALLLAAGTVLLIWAGIVALWRRSGYAHAPRSAIITFRTYLNTKESLLVLVTGSLFSMPINTVRVTQ